MAQLAGVTPIRSVDEATARESYVRFLGFEIEFGHCFPGIAPLCLDLIHRVCRLPISDMSGSSPGRRVRLATDDVAGYLAAEREALQIHRPRDRGAQANAPGASSK